MISFGLVNAPVRMYAAVSEKGLKFNLLHEPDGGRIGYQKVCKIDDKVVSNDEIVKAYEIEDGEFITLADEDFEAAKPEGYRTITIQDFVPADEIDPIYFERTYFLGPQDGPSEGVYALLAKAMSDTGLVAICTYVFHDRENLGCLRVRDGVLTLEKMFFHDEVRQGDGIAPAGAKVDKRQLEMAQELIQRYSGSFEPDKYHDTYREALLGVIESKRTGKKTEPVESPRESSAPDLLAALQASLAETKGEEAKAKPKARASSRRKTAKSA
jgi:DNA end-binding protein Ku